MQRATLKGLALCTTVVLVAAQTAGQSPGDYKQLNPNYRRRVYRNPDRFE